MYTHKIGYCMLTLSPEAFLNSHNLWWIPSVYTRLWHLQILFSFSDDVNYTQCSDIVLSSVDRTFSTALSRSGEDRYPFLVPDLRGKAFSVFLLSLMLYVSFVDALHQAEKVSFNFQSFEFFFNHEKLLTCSLLSIILLQLMRWLTTIIDFQVLKQPHFLGSILLTMVCNLCSILPDLVCQCFADNFCTSIHKK